MKEKSIDSHLRHHLDAVRSDLHELRKDVHRMEERHIRAAEARAADLEWLRQRLDQLQQSLLDNQQAKKARQEHVEFEAFKSSSPVYRIFQVVSLLLTVIGVIIAMCVGIWLSK